MNPSFERAHDTAQHTAPIAVDHGSARDDDARLRLARRGAWRLPSGPSGSRGRLRGGKRASRKRSIFFRRAPRRNGDGTNQPPSDPSAFLRSLDALGGKHALFGRWFADRVASLPGGEGNGAYVHPHLEARVAPGAGVGVFAASAIPPGHVLFRAPSALFESLSAAHAETVARRRAPDFVERCASACAALGAPAFAPHALLALHVLFELGDARSANAGYLASLPSLGLCEETEDTITNATSVPLLWDARRVATLRGTPTFAAVASRRAFVSSLHAALFGVDSSNAAVSLEKFAWALSTILSRATSGARAPYALTPGVDLFNHDGAGANCALEAEPERETETTTTEAGETRTRRAYASLAVSCVKGASRDAQLTISYGDGADNDRLLRVYGFALPGNPNDRRELRLRVEGAALEAWRAHERFGPGVLLARRAVLRKYGLPLLAPFEEMEAAAMPSHADHARDSAERAFGGGVAFRDPGDFRSALGDAERADEDAPRKNGDEAETERTSAVFFDDVELAIDDAGSEVAAATTTPFQTVESEDNAHDEPYRPLIWKCFVAHPAAPPFPARPPAPANSAAPEAARACDAATAAARGVGGGARAVSADALLASVRAHLLTGTRWWAKPRTRRFARTSRRSGPTSTVRRSSRVSTDRRTRREMILTLSPRPPQTPRRRSRRRRRRARGRTWRAARRGRARRSRCAAGRRRS